jgi:CYTH domain-containing protein
MMAMAKEIERKFLVRGDEWRHGSIFEHCCQGYLITDSNCFVRICILGERAFLTIKGETEGISRLEYEYEIPLDDAQDMLNRLCIHPLIVKRCFAILYYSEKWQIDEFLQDNEGLILAEIELKAEDQHIHLPPWVGKEVSHDPRYYNINLTKHPYSKWRGRTRTK